MSVEFTSLMKPLEIDNVTASNLGSVGAAIVMQTDARAAPIKLPRSIGQLPHKIARAYDMSVTRAISLNIPVFASASGSLSGRVVVLDYSAYDVHIRSEEGIDYEDRWGYAIRLVVSVDRWETTSKASLSFLAASAELKQVKAEMTMQVLGLTGPKIDESIIVPSELDVETFVLAKQSLESLTKAINDKDTAFLPVQIASIRKSQLGEQQLIMNVGQTYALDCISRGWSLERARKNIGTFRREINDAIADIYRNYAKLMDERAEPDRLIRVRAEEVLGKIKVSVR